MVRDHISTAEKDLPEMNSHDTNPARTNRPVALPTDPTLDAPSPLNGPEKDSSGLISAGVPIELVEGSGPALSGEMGCILKRRLRISSLVLFHGFLAFFLWELVNPDWSRENAWHLFLGHLSVTLLLGAMGGLMLRKCEMSIFQMRIKEGLIFGAPAIFFCYMQSVGAQRCLEKFDRLDDLTSPWLILIFVYAIFIPNSWQRAALLVGTLAAMPILLIGYMWLFNAACSSWLELHTEYLVDIILMMTTASIAAVVGVHTIGALRSEAMQARELGQYRLRQQIGSGGMGEVYLADHQLMKRPCAIKVIRPEKAGDPQVMARFEREVRSTAKLSHWNSINIFDYGRTEDGTFYYVMEYLPGLNLQELVEAHGPLAPARVIYLMRQVCGALHEAHQMGMLHRDIKPANIFAAHLGGQFDIAKLLDFGLAKPMLADANTTELTQDGNLAGSPLYMSPEQITGDLAPDLRSDIYALGGVMYYLLTGQPPFPGEKTVKVLVAHAYEQPEPLSKWNAQLANDLEDVVLRCLAKDPEERFASARELDKALRDCVDEGNWNEETATRWWEQHSSDSPPSISPRQPSGRHEGD